MTPEDSGGGYEIVDDIQNFGSSEKGLRSEVTPKRKRQGEVESDMGGAVEDSLHDGMADVATQSPPLDGSMHPSTKFHSAQEAADSDLLARGEKAQAQRPELSERGEDPKEVGLISSGAAPGQKITRNSTFAELGREVLHCLNESMHCKTLTTGGELQPCTSDILSPARSVELDSTFQWWEKAAVLGLKCLAEGPTPDASSAGIITDQLAKSVHFQLERFDMWGEDVPSFSFEEFFMTKTIDYRGEQVKLGQALSWEAVKNSLPESVGCLKLSDFCTLGTKHYIENFEAYLMDTSEMGPIRKPKVMVAEASWAELSEGLVKRGLCEVMPVSSLFHVGGSPLLNGMFAVGKGEFVDNIESQRLIMNLVPLNSLCGSLEGDVSTLPSLSTMSAFLLEDGEVCLTSSEDIRCFFYLFEIPVTWRRYMGFNKLVPPQLIPNQWRGQECVLVSRVLPMGFLNSVSIAQHVHRNVVRSAASDQGLSIGAEKEIRKDKGFPIAKVFYRVYLDNFDQLEVVDKETAHLLTGRPSAQVLGLRSAYESLGLPRHPKKAVVRQMRAEVQGALILGDLGVAIPKPAKVVQYVRLTLELLRRGVCTLRELQVVCGGLVYVAMFRRPLLCGLNKVWEFMETFKQLPLVVRYL